MPTTMLASQARDHCQRRHHWRPLHIQFPDARRPGWPPDGQRVVTRSREHRARTHHCHRSSGAFRTRELAQPAQLTQANLWNSELWCNEKTVSWAYPDAGESSAPLRPALTPHTLPIGGHPWTLSPWSRPEGYPPCRGFRRGPSPRRVCNPRRLNTGRSAGHPACGAVWPSPAFGSVFFWRRRPAWGASRASTCGGSCGLSHHSGGLAYFQERPGAGPAGVEPRELPTLVNPPRLPRPCACPAR